MQQRMLAAFCSPRMASPLAATAAALPALVTSATASFHSTPLAARGTKNLDWYFNAIKELEERKTRVDPPVFPSETLHGRKRARAYLQFSFGKDGAEGSGTPQKVVVELADDLVPNTVQNFLTLCERPAGQGYTGSSVFRVQKAFGFFAGDWVQGDGTTGLSSFAARYFPDENFIGRHSQPGVLAMANHGVHTNNSVFYITNSKASHLDGRNVVFGRVLQGLDVVNRIATAFSVSLKPAAPITLTAAGRIAEGSPEWAAVDKALAAAEGGGAKEKGKAAGKAAAPAAPAAAAASGAAAAPKGKAAKATA